MPPEDEEEESCDRCHTRTTPLWRKDPASPDRVLCNRCGIRAQRKARLDQRRKRRSRFQRLVAVCENELRMLERPFIYAMVA